MGACAVLAATVAKYLEANFSKPLKLFTHVDQFWDAVVTGTPPQTRSCAQTGVQLPDALPQKQNSKQLAMGVKPFAASALSKKNPFDLQQKQLLLCYVPVTLLRPAVVLLCNLKDLYGWD